MIEATRGASISAHESAQSSCVGAGRLMGGAAGPVVLGRVSGRGETPIMRWALCRKVGPPAARDPSFQPGRIRAVEPLLALKADLPVAE